jgi:hypothetical protein
MKSHLLPEIIGVKVEAFEISESVKISSPDTPFSYASHQLPDYPTTEFKTERQLILHRNKEQEGEKETERKST